MLFKNDLMPYENKILTLDSPAMCNLLAESLLKPETFASQYYFRESCLELGEIQISRSNMRTSVIGKQCNLQLTELRASGHLSSEREVNSSPCADGLR